MVCDPSTLLSSRLLLLVAHPDDECIGAGILMQRNRDIHTVFATAGAPNRPYIWRRFGTPMRCARIRRMEGRTALTIVAAPRPIFLDFPDGKLYRNLEPAYGHLANLIMSLRPNGILTHAFEGGHPDHDACSFLAARLARTFALDLWEMPYYRPDPSRGDCLVLQQFVPDAEEPVVLTPDFPELRAKEDMFAAHRSQAGVLADFDARLESFRRPPAYDYSRPAFPDAQRIGPSSVRAQDLIGAFRKFTGA